MNDKLRERLAKYAHSTWAGWMEYMFSKCRDMSNGGVLIPAGSYEHWTRQKNTAYADLPEAEKKSDREEADRILAIVADVYIAPPEVHAILEAAKFALEPLRSHYRHYEIQLQIHKAVGANIFPEYSLLQMDEAKRAIELIEAAVRALEEMEKKK